MLETVRRYIDGEEGRVAFRCRSYSDVVEFFGMIKKAIAPSYYYFLDNPDGYFGKVGMENEVCFRIERRGGRLDWGHDTSRFYIRQGRQIVDVRNFLAPKDYGEFETATADLISLFTT